MYVDVRGLYVSPSFTIASFLIIARKMPVLLDVRPYCVPGQNPGAHGSMLEFEKSFKEVRSLIIIVCLPLTSQDYPTIPRHHVVDSGFGSFDRMGDLLESGATATMSMPSNTRKWLWSTLDRGCGIDSGRTAWNPATGLLVNSFKVVSETGKIHQIKTIATGFSVEAPDEEEVAITSVPQLWYHCQFPPLVPDMRSHAHLRSEEHTSELQSHLTLVCRLLLEKKKKAQLLTRSASWRRSTLSLT